MKETPTSASNDLLHAHRELMLHLRSLQETIDPGGTIDITRLQSELQTVQTEVNEHFQFEEKDGYLAIVLERNPHRKQTVEALREEHDELSKSLEELVNQCQHVISIDKKLVADIQAWINRLREHEARENKLVQETFNLESGAGD